MWPHVAPGELGEAEQCRTQNPEILASEAG
jgi:hypothetical protein